MIEASMLLALPWSEAEPRLKEAGCVYRTEITRPARDFFKTDASRLYVVRVRKDGHGLLVTLAAKVCPSI